MKRLVAVIASDAGPAGGRAKVYKDTDWNEYRVRYFVGTQYVGEKADSFHDDMEDAIGTAKQEVNRLGGTIEGEPAA
jgi:hypothetical protein